MQLSIVIPAKNEAEGLRGFLPGLRTLWPEAEIIVVNDGSNTGIALLQHRNDSGLAKSYCHNKPPEIKDARKL